MDSSLNNIGISVGFTVAIPILLLVLFRVFFERHGDNLEIAQLYVYPIKGLRGCSLRKAQVGRYGFLGDRVFCLQRVHYDEHGHSNKRYETMFIGYNLQMALFHVSLDFDTKTEKGEMGVVVVTWAGRGSELDPLKGPQAEDIVRFPLDPNIEDCDELEVSLHTSPTKAYDMGDDLATWFSARFGCEVRLVYIGDGSRPVLGSMAPNSKTGLIKARFQDRIRSFLPFLAFPAERLVFNDIAHYLVVTEESNDEVTSRLEDDCKMDVTKFRPNIVVKEASGPFVEDFWGELTFDGGVVMPLTANCYRCQSITVDYNTGKIATDDRGMVWKKLNKYRRVDPGAKYSPVFGRYGYCFGPSVGKMIFVGQTAKVTHVNTERTIFDWPNLTTFGVSKTKM